MLTQERQAMADADQTERIVAADDEPTIVGQYPLRLPQHLVRVGRKIETVGQQAGIHAAGAYRQGQRIPLEIQQATARGDPYLVANGGATAGELGAQRADFQQMITKQMRAPAVESLLDLGRYPVPHGQCRPAGRDLDLLFGTCHLHNRAQLGVRTPSSYIRYPP